jgi:hypothetical protein
MFECAAATHGKISGTIALMRECNSFPREDSTVHSWKALDPNILKPAGVVTAAFVAAGLQDFRQAAAYVNLLPYGRNTNRTEALVVMKEGRGTCSTKHALLRRLAIEQNLNIALVIGIYQMNQRNTPGVGMVLEKFGLRSLPEAHCYLCLGYKRIDVTRIIADSDAEQITHFIHEEEIAPDQIGEYKTSLHRRFLKLCMEEPASRIQYTLTDLWRIREECIAALEQPVLHPFD